MLVTDDGGVPMLSSQGYVMTVTTEAKGMAGRPKSLVMPVGARTSPTEGIAPLARGGTGRNSITAMSVDSEASTRSQGSSEPEEDKLSDLGSALWWEGFNTLRSPRRGLHRSYHGAQNGRHTPPSPSSSTSPVVEAPALNGWGSPPQDLRHMQNLHISGGLTPRYNTLTAAKPTRYDDRALSQSYDLSMTRGWDLGSRDLSESHPPPVPHSQMNGHAHPVAEPEPWVSPQEAFRNRSVSVPHEPGHAKPPQIQYVNSGPYSYPGTPVNGGTHSLSSSPGSDTTPASPRKSWLKLNLHTISEKLFSRSSSKRKSKRYPDTAPPNKEKIKRSSSVPDILERPERDEQLSSPTGSDVDDDDFGFLSYPGLVFNTPPPKGEATSLPVTPSSALPFAGMQKSKSPTTALRATRINLNPKKWRKSKIPKAPSLWSPEGPCEWSSTKGQRLTIHTGTLLSLTEIERVTLQKVALTKLQALNLGCAITIPKEWTSKRSKRGGFTLKRRTGSTGILENLKDRGKDKDARESGSPGWVFGISIAKCISNDVELRRRKPSLLHERRESLDLPQFHRPSRKSSSSSGGAISSDSMSETDTRAGSSLLDALSLQSPHTRTHGKEGPSDPFAQSVAHHSPQVPYLVNACFKHLETYGLRVLGIFRIGSSKKRVRQLRDEFDQGNDLKLGDDQSPHDVGALLKEYFRELPDPLLTRDLYSAFIATRKIKSDRERLWALHLLVSLLPMANRDTLWALLRFLSTVVQHSTDSIDDNGQELPGNKMDEHNLATLFGPNILHKSKGGDFQVETLERAEERKEVIAVVKEMIETYQNIFEMSAGLHDEALRILQETNPEAVDILMKQRVPATRSGEGDVQMREGGEQTSIPHSPLGGHSAPATPSEDQNAAMVRHLTEALRRDPPAPFRYPHPNPRSSGRHRMSEVPGVTMDSPRVPPASYRLSVPEQEWHKPGRSISPASPRVSPSPKAMKPTPDLRIQLSGEGGDRGSPSSQAGGSSRPQGNQVRRSLGVPHGPGPTRSASGHRNTLMVPSGHTFSRTRDSGDNKSNSSLSSGYYAGSSRSGTNSPATPDTSLASHGAHAGKWYMETPPESPKGKNPNPSFVYTKDAVPGNFQRTSSLQRPLDISMSRQSPRIARKAEHSRAAAGWQPDRDWNHWECHTQQHSEDFQEQETLV